MESIGEPTNQDMLVPDCSQSTSDFFGKVSVNLALGLVTSSYGDKTACWRLAVGWGEDSALVTLVKAIRVGVGF